MTILPRLFFDMNKGANMFLSSLFIQRSNAFVYKFVFCFSNLGMSSIFIPSKKSMLSTFNSLINGSVLDT